MKIDNFVEPIYTSSSGGEITADYVNSTMASNPCAFTTMFPSGYANKKWSLS